MKADCQDSSATTLTPEKDVQSQQMTSADFDQNTSRFKTRRKTKLEAKIATSKNKIHKMKGGASNRGGFSGNYSSFGGGQREA